MCGKFTAQASWREVVDFSQPLTVDSGGGDSGGDEGAAGETITYRVGGQLPVIIWHAEEKRRRVGPMRWAIPDRNGAPKHIHARAETVEGVTWQTHPEPKAPRPPRKRWNVGRRFSKSGDGGSAVAGVVAALMDTAALAGISSSGSDGTTTRGSFAPTHDVLNSVGNDPRGACRGQDR